MTADDWIAGAQIAALVLIASIPAVWAVRKLVLDFVAEKNS